MISSGGIGNPAEPGTLVITPGEAGAVEVGVAVGEADEGVDVVAVALGEDELGFGRSIRPVPGALVGNELAVGAAGELPAAT